ncbi:MAG: tripartite tricarboxylate transporter TctB family protein [Pseudomonadota bacterium]
MNGLTCFGHRIPTKQLVGGLVFWLIIATVLWTTRNMPMYEEGAPGPRFMPVVLSVLFSVLNVFYWIESATKAAADEASDDRNLLRPLAFLSIIILLALCWETLGAVVTVFACAFLELRFLEHHSWVKSIVAGFIISAVALVLFQVVLGVALPGGVFESLSYIRF